MSGRTKDVTRFGLLSALALILGYLESLVPIGGLPGVKIGLSNTVLLYAVYLMGARQAALLMVCKVLLSGFLFGGPTAIIYSLAGGAASLGGMLLLKQAGGWSVMGVSVAGALLHNTAQVFTACLATGSFALMVTYLPVLLAAAVGTGLLTGAIARLVLRALGGKARERTKKSADIFGKNPK